MYNPDVKNVTQEGDDCNNTCNANSFSCHGGLKIDEWWERTFMRSTQRSCRSDGETKHCTTLPKPPRSLKSRRGGPFNPQPLDGG